MSPISSLAECCVYRSTEVCEEASVNIHMNNLSHYLATYRDGAEVDIVQLLR